MATLGNSVSSVAPTLANYRPWLLEKHKVEIDQRTTNHYNVMCKIAAEAFTNCEFWCEVKRGLRNLDDKFLIANKCNLMSNFDADVLTKSFDSFLEKTYRKNILLNLNFPNPPEEGWMLPENWFSKTKDILRTTLTVKFLDGAEYLLNYIQGIAKEKGISVHCDWEARLEGYYAIHLYYKKSIEILGPSFESQSEELYFEIQITTQIKEIVKSILHSFYEKTRIAASVQQSGRDWKWDYKSDQFVANNLGHILHYVEGMIVQIREKQTGGSK